MIIAASVLIRTSQRPPARLFSSLIKMASQREKPELIQLNRFNYRPPTKRMPQSPRPMAQSPNRNQIAAITISMSFSGDRGAAVAR
jgi:hypothetical protein